MIETKRKEKIPYSYNKILTLHKRIIERRLALRKHENSVRSCTIY